VPTTTTETRASATVSGASGYGAAVCRALGEYLDQPLDPSLLPASARDLLCRLWPDSQDVPAAEIGYGHLDDSWYHLGDGGPRYGNEAAVLAARLKTATEDVVLSWVERGAQRLAELDAAEAAKREEAERQRQADEARRADEERIIARLRDAPTVMVRVGNELLEDKTRKGWDYFTELFHDLRDRGILRKENTNVWYVN
jgi:hypothetical protein